LQQIFYLYSARKCRFFFKRSVQAVCFDDRGRLQGLGSTVGIK
jgi:hypothetical protein